MLLVYSHKTTARFKYIAEVVLGKLCGIETAFTSDREMFSTHPGPRMAYAHDVTADITVIPHTLLFEKGIKPQNISISKWNGIPVLFKNQSAEIPFDIFAASFFLLSRYEEYLPHITDKYNRFEADSSIAAQNDFLHLPVVNLWAIELKKIIKQKYPALRQKENSYRYISTIDIDNAWAFKHKGFVRTAGAFAKAFLRANFTDAKERLLSLAGQMSDPYDTYEHILSIQKKYKLEMCWFFLLGNYGTNDKNISANNPAFQALIKHTQDHADTGIHPSFGSNESFRQLKTEVARLARISHKEVSKSRQHFLKLHLPDTYKNLIKCGIQEDYSMGYASRIGFRAGICSPFKWYDLDMEDETTLEIIPFCIMDATLHLYMKLSPQKAVEESSKIIHEIKKANGCCVTLWHNETLSDWREWKGWRGVYEEVVKLAVN